VAFISTIELAVSRAKEEKLSVFAATSLMETIICSMAEAVWSTKSASVSAMRLTSSMLADISRIDAEVSSALADSSSMLLRTLLIERSIWPAEPAVDCADTSCSAAPRLSTRERALICCAAAETSALSCPNRRMVRSRFDTSARIAPAIRCDRVAATISPAESERSPVETRFTKPMASSRRPRTRPSHHWNTPTVTRQEPRAAAITFQYTGQVRSGMNATAAPNSDRQSRRSPHICCVRDHLRFGMTDSADGSMWARRRRRQPCI